VAGSRVFHEEWVSDFAWAWVLIWLGDAGKCVASDLVTVEQGADKAKPPVRGGFT
jgi:hypothetical protein